MTDESRTVVVLVTAPSADEAARIGRVLVDERLAACVNVVGPIRSIYRWEAKIEDEHEHLMLVKARRTDVDVIAARVRALHPYDLPEVIALDVTAGSAPYLQWLLDGTTRSGQGQT
jgi:periplasmic divalent cation tolerance protein